ncbi:hypothetical protein ACTFIV_006078 [Dictyostelium citrinum]
MTNSQPMMKIDKLLENQKQQQLEQQQHRKDFKQNGNKESSLTDPLSPINEIKSMLSINKDASKRVKINIIKRENEFLQCEVESYINDKITNTLIYFIKNRNGYEINTCIINNGNNQIKCLVYKKIEVPFFDDSFIIVNNKKS